MNKDKLAAGIVIGVIGSFGLMTLIAASDLEDALVSTLQGSVVGFPLLISREPNDPTLCRVIGKEYLKGKSAGDDEALAKFGLQDGSEAQWIGDCAAIDAGLATYFQTACEDFSRRPDGLPAVVGKCQ